MEKKEKIVEEFKVLTDSRVQSYLFLSRLYNYHAIKNIAKMLKDKSFVNSIESNSGEGFRLLRRYIKNVAENKSYDELVEDLQVEHTGLFVMPKFVKGRPYESFYLDKEQKVGARVTINVERFYRSVGAEFSTIDDLPDFIGIELEFMHFLCSKEKEAWDRGDIKQALNALRWEEAFIREHLGKWAIKYCRDFYKDATSDFFRAVSKLTEEFLNTEIKEIRGFIKKIEEQFPELAIEESRGKKGGKNGG